jgi:hypothetical protein
MRLLPCLDPEDLGVKPGSPSARRVRIVQDDDAG